MSCHYLILSCQRALCRMWILINGHVGVSHLGVKGLTKGKALVTDHFLSRMQSADAPGEIANQITSSPRPGPASANSWLAKSARDWKKTSGKRVAAKASVSAVLL